MTRPFSISGRRIRVIALMGTAKLIPADWPTWLMMAVFMPMTCPREFSKRSAGVARVDRRVGLDDSLDHPSVLGLERAVQAADDPRGQCPFQAEGVAQGQDLLADQHPRRVAERDGKELVGRSPDQEHGDVVGGILADELRRMGRAVEQGDPDGTGPLDDVEIGQQMTLLVDDEPRTGARRGLVPEEPRSLPTRS